MGKCSNLDVRFIDSSEWDAAMELVFRTFLEFDAAMYSREGVEHFRRFISDQNLKRMFEAGGFQVIGAFDGTRIAGVIALRNTNHISLLFVDSDYQKRGIGSELVFALSEYVTSKLYGSDLTVHSSLYATDFYHHLGFVDLGDRIEEDGIIYTPMRLELRF